MSELIRILWDALHELELEADEQELLAIAQTLAEAVIAAGWPVAAGSKA
jgi:hypothetical protein